MAAIAFPAWRRSPACAGSARELRNGEIPNLASHLPRIQQQAEVGGGNAGGNRWRILLHVVGDQLVVFRRAVLGEIAPGVERGAAQKHLVILRQLVPAPDAEAGSARATIGRLQAHSNRIGAAAIDAPAAGSTRSTTQAQCQGRHPVQVGIHRGASSLPSSASAAVSHSSRRAGDKAGAPASG